ncbi:MULTISPECIES: hypothetical protein [Hymenobacter]|uniref:hypothetical protein n=1 Tax=Hymenobacter TaxID=89966 RepID=UPI001C12B911|nr:MULTISPECIES: hypothetical protein [Hymenobacter]UOQ80169.1 hypothetical protein MUN83_15200 [Hymenobacter sp. 5414T-23]
MQANHVQLRKTEQADLELFFHFQLDEEAAYLAAFTPKERTNKEAYLERLTRYLTDPTIHR